MNAGQGAADPDLDDIDRARSDLYALLARLYYGGPDPDLLQFIVEAGGRIGTEGDSPVITAWKALSGVACITDPVAAQQGYDDLFVGTGRAQVSPYATYYLTPTGREKILVMLRAELASMGLSRKETSGEPEDHFAGLFDVMRHLVQRGSNDAALQDQKRFFAHFLEQSYGAFCSAVEQSGHGGFYGPVVALTRAFLDVEREALQMA